MISTIACRIETRGCRCTVRSLQGKNAHKKLLGRRRLFWQNTLVIRRLLFAWMIKVENVLNFRQSTC